MVEQRKDTNERMDDMALKTSITKGKFLSYESVRQSGVTNMFDLRVVTMLSGLTKDECIDIMEHYSSYKNQYLKNEGKKINRRG